MTTKVITIDKNLSIPKSVISSLGLKPGQKVKLVTLKNKIEIIPIPDIKSMRGFLKGIDTNIEREKDRI